MLICKFDNWDGDVDIIRQMDAMELDPMGGQILFMENQYIEYEQLPALYRSADCFVFPTRGEGWGMPILEAMACGLPVIATNWSAQQTFLTDANSYPIQVRAETRRNALTTRASSGPRPTWASQAPCGTTEL
jgi:glycosyltransferase involved in cell wall biosynthesis